MSHNSRNNFILYQNVHMQCILPTYNSLPSLWTTAVVLAKKAMRSVNLAHKFFRRSRVHS